MGSQRLVPLNSCVGCPTLPVTPVAPGYALSPHVRILLALLLLLKLQTREQKGASGVPHTVSLGKPVEVQEVTPFVPYACVICAPGHVTQS